MKLLFNLQKRRTQNDILKERLIFYLNDFLYENYKKKYIINEIKDDDMDNNEDENRRETYFILNKEKLIELIKENKLPEIRLNKYYKSLLYIIEKNIDKNIQNKDFFLYHGDIRHEKKRIGFTKTRNINDKKLVLLRSLNKDRHWKNFYNFKKNKDYNFYIKKPIIFWRGVNTGFNSKRLDRYIVIEKYFNHKKCNIGYSKIIDIKNRNNRLKKFENNLNKYLLKDEPINEFLKYKYILSLEGNDKDSGLNWKLASNSVVFMAKPCVESWLMESKLIPNYHYILLKDDYSDLIEKINWCNKNPKICINIIKNANNYMKQFKNERIENLLEKTVINIYFKYVNFV